MNRKTARYRTECINMLTIIEARQNLEQLDLGYKAMHHALREKNLNDTHVKTEEKASQ